MDPLEHFGETWRPSVLSEETLAEGTWRYGDVKPVSVRLFCQHLNYTAHDMRDFAWFIHEIDQDHPDHEVNEDGRAYFWRFGDEDAETVSPSFPTYEQARRHIETYAGRAEVR